mgnify:CR=1 FL=1
MRPARVPRGGWAPAAGRGWAVLLSVALLWAGAARADRAGQMTVLIEALRIDDTLQIMRSEALDHGTGLARDMMPEAEIAGWTRHLADIHDPAAMRELVVGTLKKELAEVPLAPLTAFFTSSPGRRIVAAELAARKAFLDRAIEDAAREDHAVLAETGAPILGRIETLIADSDLIERNVTGILNANLMLSRGLAEGGAHDLSLDDILRETRAQEDSLRAESGAWIRAYLLAAYRPLQLQDVDRYIAFWRSPPGRALNRALFAGFDRMNAQLSYLLGWSMARYRRGQTL